MQDNKVAQPEGEREKAGDSNRGLQARATVGLCIKGRAPEGQSYVSDPHLWKTWPPRRTPA
eukprot:9437298-Heterocapsa_arctica.AAC.1